MNAEFMKTEKKKSLNETEKEGVIRYEYAGYQIRIHFTGEKTLAQCMENLMNRKIDS